jgi:hypothetical protein
MAARFLVRASGFVGAGCFAAGLEAGAAGRAATGRGRRTGGWLAALDGTVATGGLSDKPRRGGDLELSSTRWPLKALRSRLWLVRRLPGALAEWDAYIAARRRFAELVSTSGSSLNLTALSPCGRRLLLKASVTRYLGELECLVTSSHSAYI